MMTGDNDDVSKHAECGKLVNVSCSRGCA